MKKEQIQNYHPQSQTPDEGMISSKDLREDLISENEGEIRSTHGLKKKIMII